MVLMIFWMIHYYIDAEIQKQLFSFMKTRSILRLVFLCILLAIPTSSHSEPKYKIGVSLALSGEAATWGLDMKNTILLAKDELLGDVFELIFEDDKCDSKTAVAIANKFATIDKVDGVIGYSCSGPLLASASIYERAKIPVVSSSASAAKISEAGDYIFRTFPNDAQAGKVLFDYISKHSKTLGVISTENEYCQGFAEQIRRANNDNSIKVLYENIMPEENDVRTILFKLKHKNIDSLFINSQSDREFLRILKQVRQLNIKATIYSAYWGSSSWLISEAGVLADGIISVDASSEEKVLNDDGKKVLSMYRKKYGEPNFSTVLVAANWEAARAMRDALTQSNDPKNYLYSTTFQGLFGEWSFDKNGDILGLSYSIKETRGGAASEL